MHIETQNYNAKILLCFYDTLLFYFASGLWYLTDNSNFDFLRSDIIIIIIINNFNFGAIVMANYEFTIRVIIKLTAMISCTMKSFAFSALMLLV